MNTTMYIISVIKYWVFILITLSIVDESFAQSPTKLGLHGVSQHYPQLGAKVLRIGTDDRTIKLAIDKNDTSLIERTRNLMELGYDQVFYLIHNRDTAVDIVDMAWQRIPRGEDRIAVFQNLDIFLNKIGPNIDWIQINQEPLGITPYDRNVYTINEVLEWWRTLAGFIDEKRKQNPAELGHLKILSPSISSMVPKPEVVSIVDSMIEFGEKYCDAISIHIYPKTIEEGRETVKYFRSQTSYPLACTEFSQSKAAKSWLYCKNTVWTNVGHRFFDLSNKELIEASYDAPMDSSDWKTFIATAPYTDNFISEMYEIMDRNCFVFACYAVLWQYGEPIFDATALLGNKTVKQFPFPNNPFLTEFTNLSASINNGNYRCQCRTSSLQEELMQDKKKVIFYPNPSSTKINLSSNEYFEHANLLLFSRDGYLMRHEKNISGYKYSINIDDLLDGIYIVRLESNGKLIGESKIKVN